MPRYRILLILLAALLAVALIFTVWPFRKSHSTLSPTCSLLTNIDIHPRVYLNQIGINSLRIAITDSHATIWTQVVSWVDQQISATLPERLEGDFRRTGELIPYAAICYRLTDDRKYRDLALHFMQGIVNFKHWGDDIDIEAAHLLYGLAIGYDWLYHDLPPATRVAVRDKLILQGKRLRKACKYVHPPLNNHRVVKLSALGVTALALYPDHPSSDWIPFVNREFRSALIYFGNDGMSCEGMSYWAYSVEYMLKYFTAADVLVETQFLSHPWIQNAADMPLYFALPRDTWTSTNMFLNIADSPRFCWYGPQYQLFKLAALTRRSEVQWLATEIQSIATTRQRANWLSLLWFDPEVPAVRPHDLPLTKVFNDWDLAIMRSNWKSDATILSFKCSPIGGHQLKDIRKPDYPGSGHCQPDANSFTIFSHGEWLVANSGPTLTKRTRNHNTLLINNKGQIGEGRRWLDGKRQLRARCKPHIAYHESNADYEYLVGDASSLYPKASKLRKYLRHFIYVRPDVLIVIDEIASEGPASIDWLLHSPGTIEKEDSISARITQGNARLKVTLTSPSISTISITQCETGGDPTQHDWDQLNVLSLKSDGTTHSWITMAGVTGDTSGSSTIAFTQSQPDRLTVSVRAKGRGKDVDIAFAERGRNRPLPQILDHITIRDFPGDADGRL